MRNESGNVTKIKIQYNTTSTMQQWNTEEKKE